MSVGDPLIAPAALSGDMRNRRAITLSPAMACSRAG